MTFDRWKNRKNIKEILGKVDPTKYEEQITTVLMNRKVSNERIKSLAYWVIYSINDNFLDRFDRLLAHPRNDSSSLDIHILRYGEEEGTRRFNSKATTCAQTEKNMIKRYGEKMGIEKWNQYKKNLSIANSIEGYIKKYGEEKGTELYNKQCARNAGNLTLERKQELFGDEMGIELFNKMKIKQSEKNTLKKFIDIHGEDAGIKKYYEKNEILSYKNSLQYYIETYGVEEGIKKCNRVKDNFSLHTFIERYGENGYAKYLENNKKKPHNLNNFIIRHGKDLGTKKYLKFVDNILCGFSMISTELFDSLSDYSTLYGHNEQIIDLTEVEYRLVHKSYLKPDFLYNNKIIEFHGDVFHANPDLFEDETFPHPFLKETTASEIRMQDQKRTEVLEAKGYIVKVVWENDFRKNKEKTIQECKDFLDD